MGSRINLVDTVIDVIVYSFQGDCLFFPFFLGHLEVELGPVYELFLGVVLLEKGLEQLLGLVEPSLVKFLHGFAESGEGLFIGIFLDLFFLHRNLLIWTIVGRTILTQSSPFDKEMPLTPEGSEGKLPLRKPRNRGDRGGRGPPGDGGGGQPARPENGRTEDGRRAPGRREDLGL